MPPMSRKSTPEFVALWVEDGRAIVWHVDVASGAADEIARLDVEGIARPDVLDLVRHMVRMRYGLVPRQERMADMPQAVLPTVEAPKLTPKQRYNAKLKESRYVPREVQIANQEALYQALARHEAGVQSNDLGDELGRKRGGTGVSLSVLERSGRARLDRDTGLWHAIRNGDGDAHV